MQVSVFMISVDGPSRRALRRQALTIVCLPLSIVMGWFFYLRYTARRALKGSS